MPIKPVPAQIRPLVQKLESYIDESEFIPAARYYRGIVILALLSKALTVARAVCTLVETGFPAEAFGLSRTLVEIFLTIRYLSTKETEERARRFAEYFAKAHEGWTKIIQKFSPAIAVPDTEDHRRYLEQARNYPLANEWTGLRGQGRAMAMEPDAYEFDATGQPRTCEYDYEVIYKWTSYFVHATVSCLESHCVEARDTFRIHARKELDAGRGDDALFNVVIYLRGAFIYAFRAMQDDAPEAILKELQDLATSYAL
jgi:uncharacterized protein DUF5677